MYVYLNDEERPTVLAALELLAWHREQGHELPRKVIQMETSNGRWPEHTPRQLGDLMDWIVGHSISPWRVCVKPAAPEVTP